METATSDRAAETPGIVDHPRFSTVKKKKLFIAVPIYGGVDPNFFTATLKFMRDSIMNPNKKFDVEFAPNIGDSAVGRARNALTRRFLESDCTDLLFIDSDLIYSNEQVELIMSHDDEVVGGLYPKKQQGDPELVLNTIANPQYKDGGMMMTVRYIGTGFIRIKRSVFEKMIERWGDEIEYKLDPDHKTTEWDFWHMGAYNYAKNGYQNDWATRYLSEDWWFCQRCQDLGIPIWADRRICLKHSGGAVYPLKYQEEKLYEQVKQEPVPVPIHLK